MNAVRVSSTLFSGFIDLSHQRGDLTSSWSGTFMDANITAVADWQDPHTQVPRYDTLSLLIGTGMAYALCGDSLPPQVNITDRGQLQCQHGWWDVQFQNVANDYCCYLTGICDKLIFKMFLERENFLSLCDVVIPNINLKSSNLAIISCSE